MYMNKLCLVDGPSLPQFRQQLLTSVHLEMLPPGPNARDPVRWQRLLVRTHLRICAQDCDHVEDHIEQAQRWEDAGMRRIGSHVGHSVLAMEAPGEAEEPGALPR